MPNAFADTNIFLYRIDSADQRKCDIARDLISEIGEELVTSTQVLQEFYVNATQKLKVSPSDAIRAMESLCRKRIVQVSPQMILIAVETSERYRISFWDSLIVEAAVAGGCRVLFTEDLNHGQSIRGLTVQNPFF
jgi:predicted nucleic acid-binding protein